MKKVWITSLVKDQQAVQHLMSSLKTYGLDVNGHFWVDDLAKMAWSAAIAEITAKDVSLWIIMGSAESFGESSVRKGLSLLALSVQSLKGQGFPVFIIPTSGELTVESLPTPLRGADLVPPGGASPGPKIVAAANMPVKPLEIPYHLYVHALPGIGLWLEIGPTKGIVWGGAMMGVSGAEIDAHGVGPAKSVPERAVLEYPVKGMKIQVGEEAFTAWAVQNRLDEGSSYYIRIQGVPEKLLFGPYAESDEAEVSILCLS